MEIFKSIIYIAVTAFMLAVIFFCPEICTAVSVFYVLILTTYLGIDVYGMIKQTKLLPPGEYKDIKPWRYIICTVSYMLLSASCFIVGKINNISMGGPLTIFISALFLLVAILFGALEGNKIVTKSKIDITTNDTPASSGEK